jgi:glycosyltransferase involved in cell wall biosynthesis
MVAVDLATSLREEFRGMCLWAPSVGVAYEEARNRGVIATSIPYMRILTDRRLSRMQAFLRTWCALGKARPHLVHAHSPYAYRAISFFRKQLGFRSIAHVQIETDAETLSWCFKIPPDRVIACAEFLVPSIQAALCSVGALETKVVVNRNSVDTSRFVPGDRVRTRHELGMNPDSRILLMLANLSPHKGQATVVQAVRNLRDRGLPVEAYFAGIDRDQSDYGTTLAKFACDLGVADSIHLLGFRKDTEQLLKAADFFVLPSQHEGLPLSILEAQAAKIPVLAAPTAGIPEAVQHGSTGYLIAANDAVGYAQTVARLLEHPSEANAIAESAYQRIQSEYSWSSYTRSISNLYRSLLSENRKEAVPA